MMCLRKHLVMQRNFYKPIKSETYPTRHQNTTSAYNNYVSEA